MTASPHELVDARRLDRRTFLVASGIAAVAAACTSDEQATTDTASGSTTSNTAASNSTASSTVSSDTTASSTTASSADPSSTASPATDSTTPASTTVAEETSTALTVADFESLGTCTLLSEKTAGPFPLDEQFDRRDITEGYPGHPLRLGLRVVDASCAPVPGAVVEIWHTDATGDYSAFADGGGGKDEGKGTTFLRGSQTANDDGIVEFMSLYPGWYPGRAVHIHLRVHIGETTVLTSQLFFDDAYSAEIFTTGEYESNGQPSTLTANDSIAGDPEAEGSLLHLSAADTDNGAGTLALLNLGIDPTAVSNGGGGGPRGGGGGGGGGGG
jgi:protocatechuate 3,4-dioxygenase beta subunit